LLETKKQASLLETTNRMGLTHEMKEFVEKYMLLVLCVLYT